MGRKAYKNGGNGIWKKQKTYPKQHIEYYMYQDSWDGVEGGRQVQYIVQDMKSDI